MAKAMSMECVSSGLDIFNTKPIQTSVENGYFYKSSHNRIALVVRPGYKDHPRDVIAAGILQHLWKEQFCQVHLTKIIGPHHHLKAIFQPTWLTKGHFAMVFFTNSALFCGQNYCLHSLLQL